MDLDEKNVYALDAGKNSWLTMTKEQILTAITQAINEGTIENIDAGFVTKIQEMNDQGVLQFWVGTTAEFNSLETKQENTLYLLTDDSTVTDIENALDDIELTISQTAAALKNDITDGTIVAKTAQYAVQAGRLSGNRVYNATIGSFSQGQVIDLQLQNGHKYLVIFNDKTRIEAIANFNDTTGHIFLAVPFPKRDNTIYYNMLAICLDCEYSTTLQKYRTEFVLLDSENNVQIPSITQIIDLGQTWTEPSTEV